MLIPLAMQGVFVSCRPRSHGNLPPGRHEIYPTGGVVGQRTHHLQGQLGVGGGGVTVVELDIHHLSLLTLPC